MATGVCAAFDIILHWDMLWKQLFHLIKPKPPRVSINGVEGTLVVKDMHNACGVVEEKNNGKVSNNKTIDEKPSKATGKNHSKRKENYVNKDYMLQNLAKRTGK